jgi:hypothetical protein
MGPHMTFHLAGGDKGMPGFMDHFVPAIERWWADMRQPALTEELKATLLAGVEVEAAGRTPGELAAERDRRLILLLQALHQSSTT